MLFFFLMSSHKPIFFIFVFSYSNTWFSSYHSIFCFIVFKTTKHEMELKQLNLNIGNILHNRIWINFSNNYNEWNKNN